MSTVICCLGAGYVGVPTAACLALKCPDIKVVVLDINEERIKGFNGDAGTSFPIFEPGLEELVTEVRGKNLFFSTDLQTHLGQADIVFVAVNTPTKTRGVGAGAATDLSAWESAGRSIGQYCKKQEVIVVEKSTVPVRTAAKLASVLRAVSDRSTKFEVLSNPEFLAEGSAVVNVTEPDRVLIGGSNTRSGRNAIETLRRIYQRWVPEERVLCIDTWSSELAKLAANAFLAQRISSINAMARVCEATGADITQVAKAVGMDSRLGSKFLSPSVGFGGSCFRKDILSLVYIARRLSLNEVADYWEQVVSMNEHCKKTFSSDIIESMFTTIKRKRIAVFGFAFKKNTSDVRETPAVTVCRNLLEEGATVIVHDPMVKRDAAIQEMKYENNWKEDYSDNFIFTTEPAEAVRDAHAIIVMTEWDCFKEYDYAAFYESMRKPAFLFDGRILLDHDHLRAIGFKVKCIGKGLEELLPTEFATIDQIGTISSNGSEFVSTNEH